MQANLYDTNANLPTYPGISCSRIQSQHPTLSPLLLIYTAASDAKDRLFGLFPLISSTFIDDDRLLQIFGRMTDNTEFALAAFFDDVPESVLGTAEPLLVGSLSSGIIAFISVSPNPLESDLKCPLVIAFTYSAFVFVSASSPANTLFPIAQTQ